VDIIKVNEQWNEEYYIERCFTYYYCCLGHTICGGGTRNKWWEASWEKATLKIEM
jgi:hypothetical protein